MYMFCTISPGHNWEEYMMRKDLQNLGIGQIVQQGTQDLFLAMIANVISTEAAHWGLKCNLLSAPLKLHKSSMQLMEWGND